MLGNSVRGVVLLLVVAMFLPTAVREIGGSLGGAFDSAKHPRDDGPASVISQCITMIVCGLFGLGLLLRCSRWLRCRDSASHRFRLSQERRAHIAPRPLAEDVPLYRADRPLPDDPDPALPLEED